MKTIKDILEEFDKLSKEVRYWYSPDGSATQSCGMTIDEQREFIEQSLTQILDELPTREVFEFDTDECTQDSFYQLGYNGAKTGLQEHIKKLRGDI